jgi:hypothetical protein
MRGKKWSTSLHLCKAHHNLELYPIQNLDVINNDTPPNKCIAKDALRWPLQRLKCFIIEEDI